MPPSSSDPPDLREPAFWSSSACAEQALRNGRSMAEAPEPGSAVLVGPPGSGKTNFLASLGRAFESGRSSEWTRFVPGRKLTALISTARGAPRVEEETVWSQTTPTITYAFQFGYRLAGTAVSSSQDTAGEMEVSILDTPGTFFEALSGTGSGHFDQNRVEELVCATRNARCLVLCVDASVGQVDRRLDLSSLVSRLLGVGPRRLLRMGAKPWPAVESPWERAPRLELPFERVLVLLTGIDSLCNDVARTWARLDSQWLSASAARIRSLAAFPTLGAWQAAEILDPLPLARDRIDGLDILASSLKPDAQLAVCGISASGLETVPRHDRDNPHELDLPAQILGFGTGEEEPIQGESPFGIWPSLLFITKGRAVSPLATVYTGRKLPAPLLWTRMRELDLENL